MLCASIASIAWYWQGNLAPGFGAASFLRLSLVLAAAWLAWPSLRRPVQWLPSGIAVLLLFAIGACAMQPRLAIAIVPIIGSLIAFAGFLRAFRGRS
ncbi:MAG: hypothetical protein ACO1RT_14800 [Planctomycetaceae bacterium]